MKTKLELIIREELDDLAFLKMDASEYFRHCLNLDNALYLFRPFDEWGFQEYNHIYNGIKFVKENGVLV
jgi:hypothetical protein